MDDMTRLPVVFKPDLSADELAVVIRNEIQKCRTALSNALDAAMNAGDALNIAEVKVTAAGAKWPKWLRENCSIAKSSAALFQQLAKHRTEIEAEIERGVKLSIRAARRLISNPRSSAPSKGQRKPPESLLAHWNRSSPDERAAVLDQVDGTGIVDGTLKEALSEMGAAEIAATIFDAVDPEKAEDITEVLRSLLTLKGSCDRRNSAGTASGDMIPDAASVSVETAVSPELNLSFPEFPQFLRRAPDNSGQPVEHAL